MSEARQPEAIAELDERLLMTPPIALNCFLEVAADMAKTTVSAHREVLLALQNHSSKLAASVREKKKKPYPYHEKNLLLCWQVLAHHQHNRRFCAVLEKGSSGNAGTRFPHSRNGVSHSAGVASK